MKDELPEFDDSILQLSGTEVVRPIKTMPLHEFKFRDYVEVRDLARGRTDVTFGILATPDLDDWSNAVLVPMERFDDGFWKPSASNTSGYTFPATMFFKYSIDIR